MKSKESKESKEFASPGWVFPVKTKRIGRSGKHVFKIGTTRRPNPHTRLEEFKGLDKYCELIYCTYQKNALRSEKDFLVYLASLPNVHSEGRKMRKYFSCDADFAFVVSQHFQCYPPASRKTGPKSWKKSHAATLRRSARLAAQTIKQLKN